MAILRSRTVEQAARPLRVLFSFDNVGATTINPFTDMLCRAVQSAGVEPIAFSWRVALVGSYDVLHLQWPEMHLRDRRWYLRPVQYALFLAMLARTRISGIPIAQTQHNMAPHEPGRRVEQLILRLATRLSSLWIRLVDEMELPQELPPHALRRTIAHGTYVDRYEDVPRREQQPGRLLFFGLIREYKGVDRLLESFAGLTDPGLTLRVCGEPDDPALAARIQERAYADPRIEARLRYLPDADLIAEIDAAEVVVLPYREMNNSGAAILALGRHRPIVVPDGKVTATLAAEAGPGWVARYDGPLTVDALRFAISSLRSERRARSATAIDRPSWEQIGAMHARAYREALGLSVPLASLTNRAG